MRLPARRVVGGGEAEGRSKLKLSTIRNEPGKQTNRQTATGILRGVKFHVGIDFHLICRCSPAAPSLTPFTAPPPHSGQPATLLCNISQHFTSLIKQTALSDCKSRTAVFGFSFGTRDSGLFFEIFSASVSDLQLQKTHAAVDFLID